MKQLPLFKKRYADIKYTLNSFHLLLNQFIDIDIDTDRTKYVISVTLLFVITYEPEKTIKYFEHFLSEDQTLYFFLLLASFSNFS